MNKIRAVIWREFIERVRTRAFVLSTLLFPVLMIGLTFLPALLERRQTEPKRIAIVDGATGEVGVRVADALSAAKRETGANRYTVTRVEAGNRVPEVRDSLVKLTGTSGGDGFDGVLVLDDASVASGRLEYLGVNVTSPSEMQKLETSMQVALRTERLKRAGIDPYLALPALREVDLQTRKVTDGRLSGESGATSFIIAYLMGFVLYLALVLYGNQVMTSVVDEKSNRIAEVLVSSLSPFQLMLGKVIGVGSVGLAQLGIWGVTATLVTTYRAPLAKLFGLSANAAAAIKMPEFRPDVLVVFLVFFVLGFLLYAAAYAAIAALCNSPQEAQQANSPITMMLVAGFISMFSLLGDPSGSMARILSFVPMFSPLIVPVRYSLAPLSLAELLLSAGILLGTMLLVVWIAGKIYRVGVLMYGKRPRLREVWRWVRAA